VVAAAVVVVTGAVVLGLTARVVVAVDCVDDDPQAATATIRVAVAAAQHSRRNVWGIVIAISGRRVVCSLR
jgi:hypothetical protein